MNLYSAALTAQRCQRNWDWQKPVTPEQIQCVLSVATAMPTKQNRPVYQLFVCTDQSTNLWLANHARDDPATINTGSLTTRSTYQNSQIAAPVVFIWFNNSVAPTDQSSFNGPKTQPSHAKSDNIAIGISAGAAALTANTMGLKTGFCACKLDQQITQYLNQLMNTDLKDNIALMMGMGYPQTDLKHNDEYHYDDYYKEHIYTKQSYDKTITVYQWP